MPASTEALLAQFAYDILMEWDEEFFRSDVANNWPNDAPPDILDMIEEYSERIWKRNVL